MRGARDVESLVWFDKYCKKGACVGADLQFYTNMIVIYAEGNEVMRGFDHLLMICGLAYAEFPVSAEGNSKLQVFKKENVISEAKHLHPCLSHMCTQYKEFMIENVRKMVEEKFV